MCFEIFFKKYYENDYIEADSPKTNLVECSSCFKRYHKADVYYTKHKIVYCGNCVKYFKY